MEHSFFSAFILLLLVTDPLGNIPAFISQLKNVPINRKLKIILREVLIAFLTLLFFMLIGKNFLHLLQLSELSMRFAGSIVMFLIARDMIFPPDYIENNQNRGEPFIVPLAIPLLAGPSSIATVMLLSSQSSQQQNGLYVWVAALALTMLGCALILSLAEKLQKLLGEKVVEAFERLMGLILIAISIEMFLNSLKIFIQSNN